METLPHPDGTRFPYRALTGEYICCRTAEDAFDAGWLNNLGSHYHCPRCWGETGMYGHSMGWCRKINKPFPQNRTEFHRCCPDGYCELEERNAS